MRSSDPCPCGSGRGHARCCAPFHRGAAEPPDAVALMRSRFAAFVLREHEYLWKTLHADHDDRALGRAALLRRLAEGAGALRYRALRVLDSAPPDAEGVARVLFLVTVFVAGQDRSFAELSCFAHDGDGWRYLCGEARPARGLHSPETLTIATW